MTPENTSFFTAEKNKDFLDLENMTEKMDNCGSSVQNLAMSIAFTENPANLRKSLLNSLNKPEEYPIKNKKLALSLPSLQPKLFKTTFKVEDCNTIKQKSAKLEPILDKYQNPVDHIFREDNFDAKKPLYKVKSLFFLYFYSKINYFLQNM